MKVDPADLKRVARLSGLTIRPEQLADMVGDVQNILDFISTISGADGTSAAYRPGPPSSPFRADEVTPSRYITDIEAMAPEARDGFFLAPKPPGLDQG